MGADLLGVVISKGVPSLMILLGFLGLTGNSIVFHIIGISPLPAILYILMIIGGVGIHILELFLG